MGFGVWVTIGNLYIINIIMSIIATLVSASSLKSFFSSSLKVQTSWPCSFRITDKLCIFDEQPLTSFWRRWTFTGMVSGASGASPSACVHRHTNEFGGSIQPPVLFLYILRRSKYATYNWPITIVWHNKIIGKHTILINKHHNYKFS